MEKFEKHYTQLNAKEQATIMLMRQESKGVRKIGGLYLRRARRPEQVYIARHIARSGLHRLHEQVF